MKILSLSDMIEDGKPCNLDISFKNVDATIATVNECFKVKKWAYFDKQSTTTKMVSTPWD